MCGALWRNSKYCEHFLEHSRLLCGYTIFGIRAARFEAAVAPSAAVMSVAFAAALATAVMHRCSRCGEEGHNVRNCHKLRGWYAQRCSSCGDVGHNSRNCAKRRQSAAGDRCPVCAGRGTLPCGHCLGSGRVRTANLRAPPAPFSAHALRGLHQPLQRANRRAASAGKVDESVFFDKKQETPHELSDKQQEWARMARARVRRLRGTLAEPDGQDMLVGGASVDAARNGWPRHSLTDSEAQCARCSGLGYLSCLSCSD